MIQEIKIEKEEELLKPSDSTKFSEIYHVQKLKCSSFDPSETAYDVFTLLQSKLPELEICSVYLLQKNKAPEDENEHFRANEAVMSFLTSQSAGIDILEKKSESNKFEPINQLVKEMNREEILIEQSFQSSQFTLNYIASRIASKLREQKEEKLCQNIDELLNKVLKEYKDQRYNPMMDINDNIDKDKSIKEIHALIVLICKKGQESEIDGQQVVLQKQPKKRQVTMFTKTVDGKKYPLMGAEDKYLDIYSSNKKIQLQDCSFGILEVCDAPYFVSYFDYYYLERKAKSCASVHYSEQEGIIDKDKYIQVFLPIPELNLILKLQFFPTMIEKIFIYQSNNEKKLVYIKLIYPPRFYLITYKMEKFISPLYCTNEQRIPNPFIQKEWDLLLKNYLSQNSWFKLDFKPEQGYLNFSTILINSFKERVFECPNRPGHEDIKKYFPQINIDKLQSSLLSVDSQYSLLSLFSQGSLNLFKISPTFFSEIVAEFNKPTILQRALKLLANNAKAMTAEEKFQLHADFRGKLREIYSVLELTFDLWKTENDLQLDPNLVKTRKVTVTPTKIVFHVEETMMSNAVLRRHKNIASTNFIRVNFTDELGEPTKNMIYVNRRVFLPLMTEIKILDQSFIFFAYSQSQLKSDSLWMFSEIDEKNVKGPLTRQMLYEEIGNLSSIKVPAKYGARLGQLLSGSLSGLIVDETVEVQDIKDVYTSIGNREYCYTDGIGKISSELLKKIQSKLKIPGRTSTIQIRYKGYKGLLAADPTLEKQNLIQFRGEMMKFKDSKYNDLCVLDFGKYREATLNRQIIILLLTLGLKEENLLELYKESLEVLSTTNFSGDGNLYNAFCGSYKESPATDLIHCGFNGGIDIFKEPFFLGTINTIRARQFQWLKESTALYVEKGARLFGIIDEYGILKHGEVWISVSRSNGIENDFQIIEAQEAILTKNPCLHPGDIRVVKVRSDPEANKAFSHHINVIVFPIEQGKKPHSCEISGSDLDGDIYFVSWDPRLIPPQKNYPSMEYDTLKPFEKKEEVKIEEVIDFFNLFVCNDQLGKVDNSHLAISDNDPQFRYALSEDAIKLSKFHGIVIDFGKTGILPVSSNIKFAQKWPDYMEKQQARTYLSTTIIGKLFRDTRDIMETPDSIFQTYKKQRYINPEVCYLDEDLVINPAHRYKTFLRQSFTVLLDYYITIERMMGLFEVKSEFEIFTGNFIEYVGEKKSDKRKLVRARELVMDNLKAIKAQYLTIFLKEFKNVEQHHLEDPKECSEEIYAKASAWYIAAYYNRDCKNKDINDWVFLDCKNEFLELEKKMRKLGTQLIGLPWLTLKEILIEMKKQKNLERNLLT